MNETYELCQLSGVTDGVPDIFVMSVIGRSVSQEPAGICRRALSALDGDVHPGDSAFKFLRFGSHRILPDEN